MFDQVDPERMNYFCTKTMENEKILESNGKIWTIELDKQLTEFVILYNFNFYEVANRFHNFLSQNRKYEFTEDEIRRHWAFIHAARFLDKPIDETYYEGKRVKYKVEEIRKKQVNPEEEKHKEQEQKRIDKEIEKMRYDRFNLITVGPVDEGEKLAKVNKVDDNQNKDLLVENEQPENKEILENVTTTTQTKIKDENIINHEPENNYNYNDQDDEVINNLFKTSKHNQIITEDQNKYNISEDNNREYEETLFPISTKPNDASNNQTPNANEESNPNDTSVDEDLYRALKSRYNGDGIHKDIEKTKTIDDFIKEDDKLREQYENLNTYYNFAVKSLNYFIPKMGHNMKQDEYNLGLESEAISNDETNPDQFESSVIKKTSEKINELFMNSVWIFFNDENIDERSKRKNCADEC